MGGRKASHGHVFPYGEVWHKIEQHTVLIVDMIRLRCRTDRYSHGQCIISHVYAG